MELEIDEVLACDERVIALISSWRGRGVKAGKIEYTMGAVDVVENGLWVSCDLFEPDDRAGMLARYEELRRTVEPAQETPAARLHAEHEHRFNERRLEEPPSLMADDFVMVDHRAVGWQEVRGQEVMRWMRSAFDISPDITARCEPLLDDGGEVVVYRVTHSGRSHDGGEFESTYDRVTVLRDGQFVRIEIFAPEAGNAMRARYEELRAERQPADAAGE
jgi:ketosteroid isomerase-like protein